MNDPEMSSRELAAQVGPHVQLIDIITTGVTYDRTGSPTVYPLDVRLSAHPDPSVEDANLDFTCSIDVTILDGDDEQGSPADGEQDGPGDGRQSIFTAQLTFLVRYGADSSVTAKLSQEQLDAFGHHSVLFTLHPYIRQRLDALTSWSGLPRLVLGTALQPLVPSSEN